MFKKIIERINNYNNEVENIKSLAKLDNLNKKDTEKVNKYYRCNSIL